LKQAILNGIFGTELIPTLQLTEEDWEGVEQIATDRYMSWDWNIGRSPRFKVVKCRQYTRGKLEIQLEVDRGAIEGIKVSGDYLCGPEIAHLEKQLTGVRYDPDDLLTALYKGKDEPFSAELNKEEFVDLLY